MGSENRAIKGELVPQEPLTITIKGQARTARAEQAHHQGQARRAIHGGLGHTADGGMA